MPILIDYYANSLNFTAYKRVHSISSTLSSLIHLLKLCIWRYVVVCIKICIVRKYELKRWNDLTFSSKFKRNKTADCCWANSNAPFLHRSCLKIDRIHLCFAVPAWLYGHYLERSFHACNAQTQFSKSKYL